MRLLFLSSNSDARLVVLLAAFALASFTAKAQPAGVVTGRVLNASTETYVETARVSVEGTTLETFTDTSGTYRLSNVPAGVATVRVLYTGLPPQTQAVNVVPGQVAQLDFTLGVLAPKGGSAAAVVLEKYVVSTTKEMDAAAIAINEQRFATNFKTVLATDEFGYVPDSNVAEFMKYMPGVTVDYVFGDARSISLNGAPMGQTPVTINGFDVSNNNGGGTNRTIELETVSLNNIARIEVSFTPTPEISGTAFAGSVNMIPRSAFERAKPVLNWNTYLMMADNEHDGGKARGPKEEWNKVNPGFELTYVRPVNSRFGFTLSTGGSRRYSKQDLHNRTWRGVNNSTNGTTFPHTTPDRPYLTGFAVRDSSKMTSRANVGVTVDYRIGPHDRLSLGYQWAAFSQEFINNSVSFSITNVAEFSPTRTVGRGGSISMSSQPRDKHGHTSSPSLKWYHDGPVWHSEVGLGLGRTHHRHTDFDKGYFSNVNATRGGVSITVADLEPFSRPRVISVRDNRTGEDVNPFAINSYFLNTATGTANDSLHVTGNAFASLRRDFFGRVPVSVKGGLDVRSQMRDSRTSFGPNLTITGPDRIAGTDPTTPAGLANSADNNASLVFDEAFSLRVPPFGFPRIEWLGSRQTADLYRERPDYFINNEVTNYNNRVAGSRKVEETISAAYLRGDAQLFRNRLKLVGGLRVEQTNVDGEAELRDPTRNFRRDSSGRVILGPNGRPLTIAPDPLEISRLTRIDRGAHVEKEYLRWFPSINGAFDITEKFKAKAGYFYSVGRPPFGQYVGSLSLPDTELPPSASNQISVNNPAIKAYKAKTTKAQLEYYFERGGVFTVGAYRREYQGVFASTRFQATPEFLALYDLEPSLYGTYDVATNYNLPTPVRMEGFDFSYKQPLTFLPEWARGLQVFVNGSTNRLVGSITARLNDFHPKSGNWGISISRPKYSAAVRWNQRASRPRGFSAVAPGVEPGTREYENARTFVNVDLTYNLRRRFSVFVNLVNITGETEDLYRYGPNTAPYARFAQREDFGGVWTLGLKGSF